MYKCQIFRGKNFALSFVLKKNLKYVTIYTLCNYHFLFQTGTDLYTEGENASKSNRTYFERVR
jgi:hypothetical protein